MAAETFTCEYRRYRNAEPCGKPTRRTVGDKPICSACIRTNGGTAEAFKAGETAQSANGNFRSERENGRAVLFSYRQPIAIRRAEDGQVFTDAHSYGPTTSGHQREIAGWRDGLSFTALNGLLGPEWWKTARVVETAPQYCESEFCKAARERAAEQRRAMSYRVKVGEHKRPAHGYECSDDCPPEHEGEGGTWHDQPYGQRMVTVEDFETRWYEPIAEDADEYHACLFPNVERLSIYDRRAAVEDGTMPADVLENGQHALTVAGEQNGHAFTLLSVADPLSATGGHVGVLCGLDYGRSNGQGTQLWAAILPATAYNVDAALAALNPFAARVDAYGRTLAETETPEDVKRQGDLFFRPVASACPCPCHWKRPDETETEAATRADAAKRAGILNADGTIRKRHGCHVAGNGSVPAALESQACKRAAEFGPHGAIRVDGLELPDKGGRHVPTYAAINAKRETFARGMVRHPQHSPIMLKTWHRVERSRAVRATSAELRQGWQGGRFGYD